MCHILSGGRTIRFVFLFSIFLYVCPLCCKGVPSFDSSLSICFIFGEQMIGFAFIFHFLYVCPLCCKGVPSFDSSLSICFIFGEQMIGFAFIFHFLYVCPLCCKGVPSFDSSLSTYGTEYCIAGFCRG